MKFAFKVFVKMFFNHNISSVIRCIVKEAPAHLEALTLAHAECEQIKDNDPRILDCSCQSVELEPNEQERYMLWREVKQIETESSFKEIDQLIGNVKITYNRQ